MVIVRLGLLLVLISGLSACSHSSKKDTTVETNNKSEKLILAADDMNSFNNIINSDKPVLVDFYADWCAPCKMMSPILEQVASDLKGEVKVLKVNVDNNREAATKYGIRSIPTLILFQNGKVKWQGMGVIQADKIKQIVSSKTE